MRLLEAAAVAVMTEELFPLAAWITPNIPEAELICRRKISAFPELLAAAKEHDVGCIVIGNPINMNGTFGPRAEKVQAFVELLQTMTDLPIVKFDERLTTAAAHRILNETNIKSGKRKTVIDTLSAQIILQNYLDANRNRKSETT